MKETKYYKTLVDNIYFGKQGKEWRFFDKDLDGTYHVVGRYYPSKDTLLSDMYRYLTENWGLIL
jgi:hypothetical protein